MREGSGRKKGIDGGGVAWAVAVVWAVFLSLSRDELNFQISRDTRQIQHLPVSVAAIMPEAGKQCDRNQ
jgi:hypothetical protein